METLLIVRMISGGVVLKDANGYTLGTFQTAENAEAWARENGYRTRRQYRRIEMKVVRRGAKWIVQTEDGSRDLGEHDSKDAAEAQLRAIEASKNMGFTPDSLHEPSVVKERERMARDKTPKDRNGNKLSLGDWVKWEKDPHGRMWRVVYLVNEDEVTLEVESGEERDKARTGHVTKLAHQLPLGRMVSVNAFCFGITPGVGKWDRFTSWGEKVKDGIITEFNEATLGEMVKNFAARKNDIAMCHDHQSAYVEANGQPAPALAYYSALAVVREGKVTAFASHDPSVAQPDPAGLEDGLYGYRSEVTPLGEKLLPNYRYLSPMFTDMGANEQGKYIGWDLFDVAATNTPFQDGVGLTLHRGRTQKMANSKSERPDAVVRCPWCSKWVGEFGGRLEEHDQDGTPTGGVRDGNCYGGGERTPTGAERMSHGIASRRQGQQVLQFGGGSVTKQEWLDSLKADEEHLRELQAALATVQRGGSVPGVLNPEREIEALRRAMESKKRMIATMNTVMGGNMNPELMRKLGLAEDATADDKIGAMVKYMEAVEKEKEEMARRMADSVAKDTAEAVKMDVDPNNLEQNAAIHLKTGNVHDREGEKQSKETAALRALRRDLKLSETAPASEIYAAFTATRVPMSELAQVKADLATLQAERQKEQEAARLSVISSFADEAIREGRWDPSKRAELIEFAKVSETAARASLLPKGAFTIMRRLTTGGAPVGAGDRGSIADVTPIHAGRYEVKGMAFSRAVAEYRAKNPTVTLRQAQLDVAREQPDLAREAVGL